MTYTNSSLVNYTLLSPNHWNGRTDATYNPTGKITKITIHHVAGNASVETLGNIFYPVSRGASANYGVGSDGRIGMYVEEKNAAWTSNSVDNDYKAITIEVANIKGEPNWEVSDAALNSVIKLCVDICKRNGIAKLNYTGDATGNLTMHSFFIATACPGPYLRSKFSYIAGEVNKQLSAGSSASTPKPTPTPTPKPSTTTTVKVGDLVSIKTGATYYNGNTIPPWIITDKWYISSISGDRAVLGKNLSGSNDIKSPINTKYLTVVTAAKTQPSTPATPKPATTPTPAPATNKFEVGAVVTIKSGAVYYDNGSAVPAWVINDKWYISSISGDRAVLGKNLSGANNIQSPVSTKYLTVVTAAKGTTTPKPSTPSTPKPASTALKVGDKVKLQSGAPIYGTSNQFASFVYNSTLYVREINGSRIVISTVATGAVTGAVDVKYLTKI